MVRGGTGSASTSSAPPLHGLENCSSAAAPDSIDGERDTSTDPCSHTLRRKKPDLPRSPMLQTVATWKSHQCTDQRLQQRTQFERLMATVAAQGEQLVAQGEQLAALLLTRSSPHPDNPDV